LPKFDIDDIEISITKEISIFIDLWFILNVKQTLQNIWSFELSECHL